MTLSCVLLGSARPGHCDGKENLRTAALRKAHPLAVAARKELARKSYEDLVPMLRERRAAGLSLRDIAAELNAQGHQTRRGRPWNSVQVMRVLKA
jgi:hypothetical protein